MSLWDKHQDRSMTFDIWYTYIIIYIITYLGNPLWQYSNIMYSQESPSILFGKQTCVLVYIYVYIYYTYTYVTFVDRCRFRQVGPFFDRSRSRWWTWRTGGVVVAVFMGKMMVTQFFMGKWIQGTPFSQLQWNQLRSATLLCRTAMHAQSRVRSRKYICDSDCTKSVKYWTEFRCLLVPLFGMLWLSDSLSWKNG